MESNQPTGNSMTSAPILTLDDDFMPDAATVDAWTADTGLDLAERTLARLLTLNESDERNVDVYCFVGSDWERGEDAKYLHRDRTIQGIKFSHSRFTRTLEIRVALDHAVITAALVDGNDWGAVSVFVQADRLGQNGKIRNARVTLGYMVGSWDNPRFVACEDTPGPRSVAIYRALGASAQADAMQRQIDAHNLFLTNQRSNHDQ